MTTTELLGKVAAQYLKDHISQDDSAGTARYLLDCLTAEQTAGVAKTILADGPLSRLVEIKLPKHFVGEFDLPPECLTTERTTYFRNASCDKSALLVANTGDDEEQSLKELVPVGAQQLLAHPELWVDAASADLPITADHQTWWKQALRGLIDGRPVSLDRYSDYVFATRSAILNQGQPIRCALGYALPALHLPRDTNFFNALNDATSRYSSKWKCLFLAAFKKRACYLVKQTPTQSLLDQETLQSTFEKIRESIPATCHDAVQRFIEAPSGWNPNAEEIAGCEWEAVKPLFDGLRRETFNLGKATIEFYDERDPALLSEFDREYLTRLIARKTTEPDDEDEAFYRDHRLELKEKPALKARWDRFIYGAPVETEDLVSGLAQCLQALFDQDQQSSKRKLTISSDKRVPKDLKDLNRDAGLYFAFRYKGFKELAGRSITWELGKLLDFPQLDELWRSATKPHWNRSVAKAALQIKFFLDLEVTLSNGQTESYSKQLIWKFNPDAITSEMHHDWARLAEHALVFCRANREIVSGKGRFQSIDLKDVRTLLPTYDKDRGSLVAVYRKENDIRLSWEQSLQAAIAENRITKEIAERLGSLFSAFAVTYSTAIKAFSEEGLCSPALTEQLKAYSSLLSAICKDAKGDRNRETLLKPILQIGAVPVEGGTVASITAPWHPLRMAAMANKALQVSGLIRHLISAESIFFGDTKLYFEELKSELDHPYYPELVVGWHETKPELLAFSDHHLDYTLHEPPTADDDFYADTNENPGECAIKIIEILKQFLALHPHEQANLSVVLYNCDSARLPQALVDKIQEIHEEEDDMRCQVILRHRDGGKLRSLYERIIESSDSNVDSFVASEATRDFMARLRIGIMADEAPPPEEGEGPPTDVVFLQDVIARHAQVEWYPESAVPLPLEDWVPPRWSRRRPAASDDMKSVVYLCCPVASDEGWSYTTAVTTFFKGDWDGEAGRRLLPARQLNFNDPTTAQIFKEIHNLGNWVVNYDELLDRRQLVNQHVKVIRYKQTDTQGRNMLISSNCSTTLLHRMVRQRLRDLTLGLSDEQLDVLAKRLIDEANLVSGDLVLRAAKRGRNASELIGVVLSKYLISRELTGPRYFGWYFLDDYADWLGQKEEQIADILALSPETDSAGNKRLAVVISESKYIDYGSLSPKRKESQRQLRQTIDRIAKAVFGDPGRLDRDIWLSRFSDLILNGIHFPANAQLDLSSWRRAIRDGQCSIYLRGYSHIFVSGPTDCPECSDFAVVADCEDTFQEVFSRAKLRELILHYWGNSDPAAVRRSTAAQDIWIERKYERPSERITTLASVATKAQRPRTAAPESKPAAPEVAIVTPQRPKPAAPPITGTAPQPQPQPPAPAAPAQTPAPPLLYPVPPSTGIDLLLSAVSQNSSETDGEEETKWLKEVENRTKGALQQFQLQSRLVSSTLTPNAAILKFQGSANLTVEQVAKKRSEFLTTHGLNLISVRAEPGLVALSVARPKRRILSLRDVWRKWQPVQEGGNQEILIGVKEDDGGLLMYSPRKHAPHGLIAGSTGSGKSVLMQNIILGIAATNAPAQAKILLIDPKLGVDYFAFENLPHLQQGLITDQDQAVVALDQLVNEMNRRYQLLRDNRVNNIFDLLKKPTATEKPPILWVIHDEFAEWMLTEDYSKAVENVVSRLGVKARAAGIFLIFAAQRPDANVMPMQLRANLGNRLVLRVDGEGTSEIALGSKGAERLLGKGHLCAKLEGEADLIFAQVPFVSSEDLEEMVASISQSQADL
jgi:S-DNA-T family DNA segregation ATPase FtsK/SpoIIIE